MMEGGQKINRSEMILRNRVINEIDTHERIELSDTETFVFYWFGCCSRSNSIYSHFFRRGIKRL